MVRTANSSWESLLGSTVCKPSRWACQAAWERWPVSVANS